MGRSWCSVYGKNGEVGKGGTPMIFVGYAKNHAGDCYCMYNPNAGFVNETRDNKLLHCMYYGKPEARNEVIVYLQIALPFEPEHAETREGVKLKASEPKAKSKDDKKGWSIMCTRSGRVLKPPVLYMKEFGTNSLEDVLSGRFDHTNELKVKKFKEAMTGQIA